MWLSYWLWNITSEEWKRLVAPMFDKTPEDILHGAFAVILLGVGLMLRLLNSFRRKNGYSCF
jgi:hypothetical protein